MVSLRSMSGDSLAEPFYHDVGYLSFGLALFVVSSIFRR
jgi:hypothetical protein